MRRLGRRSAYGAIPYYEAQAGFGSAMQRGEGSAFREGSLGANLSFTDSNLIALAIGGIVGILLWKKKVTKPGFLGITT